MSHFIHKRTGRKVCFYDRFKVFQKKKKTSEILAIYDRLRSTYDLSLNVSCLGPTVPGGRSDY